MDFMNRRGFLKTSAVAVAATSVSSRGVEQQASVKSTIYVVHGKDVKAMLATGIARMGGWKAFVKNGKKATVKPNVAWPSLPEQGGNTDPVLVGECVAACKAAGASEVVVPENSCTNSKQSFDMSGILRAVKKAGGVLYDAKKDEHFRKTPVPQGKILKETYVASDIMDTGCLINLPVAKNHSSATITVSMKNWMGAVKDRREWHKKGLHQCIADCSTLIKPTLIIADATRIMLTKGPRGPGEQAYPNELIFGTDPVAVDAYVATLFKKKPFDIEYIKIAHDMGIGCGDLSNVNIVRLET